MTTEPTSSFPVSARSSVMRVLPDWIDLNGHLNLAYYHVLFDQAAGEQLDALGLKREDVPVTKRSTFVAESHVVYLRELHEGAAVHVDTRIVDFDDKRMHIYQELRHADGWLAATVEAMVLSIDLSGPKVAPWAPEILAAIEAAAEASAALPPPAHAGRRVAIPRKSAG